VDRGRRARTVARHEDPGTRRASRTGVGGAIPHGWAVLAVVLALMALVAAISAAPGGGVQTAGRQGRTAAARDRSRGASRTPAPAAGTGPAAATGGGPGAGTGFESSRSPELSPVAKTAAQGLPITASAPPSAGSAGLPIPTGPVPSIPTGVPAPVAAVGTSPVPQPATPATQTDPGYLQYPDDVSAQYQYPASGSGVTAAATWAGTASLSLSVSCPGVQQSRSGPSGLQVGVTGGTGECTITLAELQPLQTAVSYSMTIGPGAA